MSAEIQELLVKSFEGIKDQLVPGVVYYARRIKSQYGSSGTSFQAKKDGKVDTSVPDLEGELSLADRMKAKKSGVPSPREVVSQIAQGLETSTMAFFTLSLENGFRYEIADVPAVIKAMHEDIRQFMPAGSKYEILVQLTQGSHPYIPELDCLSKYYHENGPVEESSRSHVDKEIYCLYKLTQGELKTLYLEVTNEAIEVQSIPEIPGHTTLYVPPAEDLTLDASDVNNVYAFMESGSPNKVNAVLGMLADNSELKTRLENRYLNLIKARKGENATLGDMAEATLKRKEIEKLRGNDFAKDYLSFSYCDYAESEMVVAFIGSMILNHLDMEAYQKSAEACKDVQELIALYNDTAEVVKKGIEAEAKNFPEGWYSQLCAKFSALEIKRVLFEKTHFDVPNSRYFKAFIFYLNLNQKRAVYLDVFQSDVTNLTEMFWFLPEIPTSSWGDTAIIIPDSTLGFPRVARFRNGDDGSWKSKKSPKP